MVCLAVQASSTAGSGALGATSQRTAFRSLPLLQPQAKAKRQQNSQLGTCTSTTWEVEESAAFQSSLDSLVKRIEEVLPSPAPLLSPAPTTASGCTSPPSNISPSSSYSRSPHADDSPWSIPIAGQSCIAGDSPMSVQAHTTGFSITRAELVQEVTLEVGKRLDDSAEEMIEKAWAKGQPLFERFAKQQVAQTQALQDQLSTCMAAQRKVQEENHLLTQSLENLLQRLTTTQCLPLPLAFYDGASDASKAAALAKIGQQADTKAAALKVLPERLSSIEETEAAFGAPSPLPCLPIPKSSRAASAASSRMLSTRSGCSGGAPSTSSDGSQGCSFNMTLRRADDSPVGLIVSGHPGSNCVVVKAICAGGAMDAWNRQCRGTFKEIHIGDRFVKVNEATKSEAMVQECQGKKLLKFKVERGSQSNAGFAEVSAFTCNV